MGNHWIAKFVLQAIDLGSILLINRDESVEISVQKSHA